MCSLFHVVPGGASVVSLQQAFGSNELQENTWVVSDFFVRRYGARLYTWIYTDVVG